MSNDWTSLIPPFCLFLQGLKADFNWGKWLRHIWTIRLIMYEMQRRICMQNEFFLGFNCNWIGFKSVDRRRCTLEIRRWRSSVLGGEEGGFCGVQRPRLLCPGAHPLGALWSTRTQLFDPPPRAVSSLFSPRSRLYQHDSQTDERKWVWLQRHI